MHGPPLDRFHFTGVMTLLLWLHTCWAQRWTGDKATDPSGLFPPALRGQGFGGSAQSLGKCPAFDKAVKNGLQSTHSVSFLFWKMNEREWGSSKDGQMSRTVNSTSLISLSKASRTQENVRKEQPPTQAWLCPQHWPQLSEQC